MAFLGNVEYRPDENGVAASVKCPLVDSWIDPGDCQSNQGVIDRYIPACFKVKPDWKKICESCPFRDYGLSCILPVVLLPGLPIRKQNLLHTKGKKQI